MVRIVELEDGDGPDAERVYKEILAPSFPADELCPLDSVREMASAGLGLVWTAVEDDEIVGCALGEWDADLRIMLLAWLAVRPGRRGGGVGGPLLDAAMADWRRRHDPCLILAEVENPQRHHGSEAFGDPMARLRFYTRRGGRVLDVPYFQPALGPGQSRVHDLFLMVLHAHESFAGTDPDTIDATVLRRYLESYEIECEGAIGTDDDAVRLWQALDRPGGVSFADIAG